MSFPHSDSSNDPVDAREQQVLDEIAGIEADSPLTIEVREQEGVHIIQLSGELDVATAPQFDERISGVQGTSSAGVVVDLSSLSFLDSKGLASFLRAAARSPERISIASPRERITRLFQATGLAERLKVKPSLAEAIAVVKMSSAPPPLS
jgi:anti-sigma B factor antagonist